jgi:hypothetical protein
VDDNVKLGAKLAGVDNFVDGTGIDIRGLKDSEAKFFKHLTSLQGSVIPKFFGESTCNCRIGTASPAVELRGNRTVTAGK